MYETKRMLLATSDARTSGDGELRVALLSTQLKLEAFDTLIVKRSSLVFGNPSIEFRLAAVRGDTLSAFGPGAEAPVWRTAPGTAAELIVEMGRTSRADLTVLAPYRRNPLLELLAPSDSRAILRRSRNSLLLVHSKPTAVYRKVLVAVDFSADCYAAARVAMSLAPDAHFTFVHAYRLDDHALMRECELPPTVIGSYLARACQAAWEQLNQWIEDLGPFRQSSVGAVHSGFPIPVINAAARRISADLVVIGREGRTRAAQHGLGAVARRLGTQGPCDVLIGPALAAESSAHMAAGRLCHERKPNGSPTAAGMKEGE